MPREVVSHIAIAAASPQGQRLSRLLLLLLIMAHHPAAWSREQSAGKTMHE